MRQFLFSYGWRTRVFRSWRDWNRCRFRLNRRPVTFMEGVRFDVCAPRRYAASLETRDRGGSGQTQGKKLVDARILQEFRTIAGDRGLITSQEELKTYECDGLTNFR